MKYVVLLIIGIYSLIIFRLVVNLKRSKRRSQSRIKLLEDIIREMQLLLEDQNQKIELLDQLKLKLRASNETLNNSIFNFNFELLENIFKKK
jgi:type II secretory pathway component PulJ